MATSSSSALRSALITVAVFLVPPMTMGFTTNDGTPALSLALAEPPSEEVYVDFLLDGLDDSTDDTPEPSDPEDDDATPGDAGPTDRAEAAQPGPAARPDVPSGSPTHAPRPEERTRSRGTGKRKRCQDTDPRIAQDTDTAWAVERSLIEEVTGSIKAINELGYAKRHHTEEGPVDGFRVNGIKCGSPLHAGGLRNGDVIHSVNGQRVTTWPKAILLYRKLRKQEAFTVHVTRKGQPVQLHYRVT